MDVLKPPKEKLFVEKRQMSKKKRKLSMDLHSLQKKNKNQTKKIENIIEDIYCFSDEQEPNTNSDCEDSNGKWQ